MSLDLSLSERYTKAQEKIREYALEIHETALQNSQLQDRVDELEARDSAEPIYRDALLEIAAGRGKYAKLARKALDTCVSDTELSPGSAAS